MTYKSYMKTTIVSLFAALAFLSIICGCGQSKPEASAAEQKPAASPAVQPSAGTPAPATATTAPSTPASPATVPPATPATTVAPTPAAAQAQSSPSATAANAVSPATEAASQLAASAKTQGDAVLSSVGNDLTAKVKDLVASAAGNEALKSQLTSSLKSLAGGNEGSGLNTLYQTAQLTGLTPSQIGLAKEVGNLASAYVVQKNFASLDGAQGDVATVVNSLRQGQFAPAVPAVQRIAQNASLTSSQKQLLGSIADKYAPGISKAAGSLTEGLQKIPGLGGK